MGRKYTFKKLKILTVGYRSQHLMLTNNLLKLQTRVLEEMIKESKYLFWFFRWFVRIKRSINAKQSIVFGCMSLGCLNMLSVKVITLAFMRVAILITCLACAKSLINNTVVITLHFLMNHGQKNPQTCTERKGWLQP